MACDQEMLNHGREADEVEIKDVQSEYRKQGNTCSLDVGSVEEFEERF